MTDIQYTKQQIKMLSLSSISNQETLNQLRKKKSNPNSKDMHVTHVIQLTEATEKNTSKDNYPEHQRQLQTPCQGMDIQLAQHVLPFTAFQHGFSPWANAPLPKLPFADGEQNQKFILPQNAQQLASAFSTALTKMQQAAATMKAAQHSPRDYPAAAKLWETEPQRTRLASSPKLKPQFKKSINLRNKGEWEMGVFCLKHIFLERFPLENSCEQ